MTIYIGTTGHRPDKIGGYGNNNLAKLLRLEFRRILRIFKGLTKDQLILNSGMALGWDTYAVAAAIVEDVPFRAIVPFKGQERVWPDTSQRIYRNALTYAQEVVVCSNLTPTDKHTATRLLLERDQRIVDDSDIMVACWNGSKGGTAHKPILVINPSEVLLGIYKTQTEIEEWFKNAISGR